MRFPDFLFDLSLSGGHVPFPGPGWIRPVYFVLMTTHTILAFVMVPMILITLRRALKHNASTNQLYAAVHA